jgi:hypothetical protein
MGFQTSLDLVGLESALTTYLRLPERERTREGRLSVLRLLKVPNPEKFLDSVWSPQWELAVDRLLDPSNLRFRPLELNDFHFKWALGSVNHLPREVKVCFFALKIRPTGLEGALDALLADAGHEGVTWDVLDFEASGKVHVESIVTLQVHGGPSLRVEVSHFSPAAERIYEEAARTAGLPAAPTVVHTSNSKPDVLLQIPPQGMNLVSPEADEVFFQKVWEPVLVGVGKLDALGDALGSIVRDAHNVYTNDGEVVSIHNYELFHDLGEYRFGFLDPIFVYLEDRLPEEVDVGGEDRLEALFGKYRQVYLEKQRELQEGWGELEACLNRLSPWVDEYVRGQRSVTEVIEGVRERLFRDGEMWLSNIHDSFLE